MWNFIYLGGFYINDKISHKKGEKRYHHDVKEGRLKAVSSHKINITEGYEQNIAL